jgi:NAD(P)-dependent dehydrogenase (short-subunit alcohol dehydrogenase family)
MTEAVTRRDLVTTGLALALAGPASVIDAQIAPAPPSAPRSTFGRESTAEEVTAGIDLSGKTAVVTGCTSGIGYETTRVLALRGAHVIGTARTKEKGTIAQASLQGRVTPVVLELSDFDSVAACADEIDAMREPIDMLICNAGVLYRGLRQVRGLEMHFVVNHLGHFILVNRLLQRVLEAPQGRVVVVGSNNHREAPEGGIQFGRLSGEGWDYYYHHSKLANGLFSLHLATLLTGTRATANCVTPGGVRDTGILRNISASSSGYPKSPAQGAATQCYVATHPSLAGVSGLYFADCNPAAQSEHQKDAMMAARLWAVSAESARGYV